MSGMESERKKKRRRIKNSSWDTKLCEEEKSKILEINNHREEIGTSGAEGGEGGKKYRLLKTQLDAIKEQKTKYQDQYNEVTCTQPGWRKRKSRKRRKRKTKRRRRRGGVKTKKSPTKKSPTKKSQRKKSQRKELQKESENAAEK